MSAEPVVRKALRVRHHAKHRAPFVENAGNVLERSIRIGVVGRFAVVVAVAKGNAAVAFKRVQGFIVGVVVAVVVGDGNSDDLTGGIPVREWAVRLIDTQMHVPADKFEIAVADQCAGQQAAFGQHLKSVADPEDMNARGGFLLDVGDDRRIRRHGAAAQVIAIGEPTGNGNKVEALGQGGVAVPDHLGFVAGDFCQGDRDVTVAIRSGENDNGGFHVLVAHLDPVGFDDRVGEQLFAHVVDRSFRLGFVRFCQVKLDELALPHAVNARKPEGFECVLDCFALGVENARFECYVNRRFCHRTNESFSSWSLRCAPLRLIYCSVFGP